MQRAKEKNMYADFVCWSGRVRAVVYCIIQFTPYFILKKIHAVPDTSCCGVNGGGQSFGCGHRIGGSMQHHTSYSYALLGPSGWWSI
jgi:hypothetical protein